MMTILNNVVPRDISMLQKIKCQYSLKEVQNVYIHPLYVRRHILLLVTCDLLLLFIIIYLFVTGDWSLCAFP